MTDGRPLKCFLSYTPGTPDAEAVAAVLHDLNVDTYMGDIFPGEPIAPAIVGAVRAADFVCLVLSESAPSAKAAFEAGLAIGLGKPVLALARGPAVPFEVSQGIQVIRLKSSGLSPALPDIRRFVRHVRPKHENSPASQFLPDLSAVDQATAELIRARQVSSASERGRALVEIVTRLLSQLGFEVLREDVTAADNRPDLLVWGDPLVLEFGGPMIVECKYYSGGSGSVLLNAGRALAQLAKYVEKSSAGLGLLVFDHSRPTDIKLSKYETPKALAFYVGDLVEVLAAGKLTDEIWRRRARAARLRGPHGDAG